MFDWFHFVSIIYWFAFLTNIKQSQTEDFSIFVFGGAKTRKELENFWTSNDISFIFVRFGNCYDFMINIALHFNWMYYIFTVCIVFVNIWWQQLLQMGIFYSLKKEKRGNVPQSLVEIRRLAKRCRTLKWYWNQECSKRLITD